MGDDAPVTFDQALRDDLTGLFNRRHLNDALPTLFALARRDTQTMALVIIDLDHFKSINDRHGHAAGDRLLAAFGELLAAQGIALTHANVSDHAARQERPPPSRLLAVSGDEVEAIREGTLRLPTGLVDLYA